MADVDSHPSEADARSILEAVCPELTWRPFGRDDLPAIAEFYADCEAYDHNPERHSLSALQEFWDSPRSHPDADTLVGYDDSGIVATAWAGCNRVLTDRRGVYLGGAVRPDRRGQGIGRAVLRWEMAHGFEWDFATRQVGYGPLVMRLYAPSGQADVRNLAERHGLAIERFFFELSRRLSDCSLVPELDGVRIVGWDTARSSPEVHRVVDQAFQDHWGHTDRTDEMWDEVIGSADFRPEWSVLAIDGDTETVVGAAINCAYEQDWQATGITEGYTDQLAVARDYRGRGIASALLKESMRRFAASGMDAAALGVDAANPFGALRLYEGLGYKQTASTCVHQFVRPAATT